MKKHKIFQLGYPLPNCTWKNANFPWKKVATPIVSLRFPHCLARVLPTKISWKGWFFQAFPAIFLRYPYQIVLEKRKLSMKKRWQRPLFFCGFVIVLLGYPLQSVHEKAWFFHAFPVIFLGNPLPNCIEKRKFSRKTGGKTIVFRWFLHCLARVPLSKISWKRNGFSMIFQ